MRKFGGIVWVFVAAFLGVLAASSFDRFVLKRPASPVVAVEERLPEIAEPAQQGTPAPFDFRAAAKRVMGTVVSVDKSETIRDFFSDRVSTVQTGTGSGVIIDAEGYVLTNNHVVQGADSVTVRLADQRAFAAKIVGLDPRTDLALLKLDGVPNLKAAELGDSKSLEIGQWVMAIGNPLGYDNTLSVGVVSSLNRTLTAENTFLVDTIQTDAAINSGNSGGALTDDKGRLVGINSAIATPSGGSVGIGFAIPIDRAKKVVAEIRKFGHVRYGYMGFDTFSVTIADPRARRVLRRYTQAEPPEKGLIVSRVDPSGPAGQQGLKPNDVIQEIDGKATSQPFDLYKLLLDKRSGDGLQLKVWSNGQSRSITMKLAEE